MMTFDDRPDDALRTVLHDAVSDVHPDPALDRILRRTTVRAPAPHRARTWLAVAAAAATVVAIVGGITLVNRPSTPPTGVSPAGPPTAGAPTARPSAPSTTGGQSSFADRALAIYYVGDTPQGPRLYREFRRVRVNVIVAPIHPAVDKALTAPEDPDYRTPWPAGTTSDQTRWDKGTPVIVSLTNGSTDLRRRPLGMSAEEAQAAVQQLVYTVQATVQNREPVRFQIDTKDTGTLLGVDVSAPVPAQPQLDVLALVNITEPAEGAVVRGSFTAHGVASSFEANVPWQITKDGTVVKQGYSTADGWTDKLYPWQSDPIDVSGLAPGSYTFEAMTDDPSNGEGSGPQTDTRTIVVRR
jgi:hypothetical protein